MRDLPLVLHVPWGKKRHWLDVLDSPLLKKKHRAPQKKEEPRGNGAQRIRKT
jgi:hypothetical protein